MSSLLGNRLQSNPPFVAGSSAANTKERPDKFKGFFTLIAFIWLWGCGFAAAYLGFSTGKIAWFGLLISAWALPVWMLMRYRNPVKYSGDQRETPAFAAVLAGLAVALLADTEKGAALYLSIVNLFVMLVYLFHLSALRHPPVAMRDSIFPGLKTAAGKNWVVSGSDEAPEREGALLIFLRGSYCADSRALLTQLSGLEAELERCGVQLVLLGVESDSHWWRRWCGLDGVKYVTLDVGGENSAFVAAGGVPFWFQLVKLPLLLTGKNRAGVVPAGACRPSCWLLDRDGYVVWHHLPGNYRVPGCAGFLKGQLFRLQE